MPEHKLERVEVAPGQYLSLNERDRKVYEEQRALAESQGREVPYIQTPGALSSQAEAMLENELQEARVEADDQPDEAERAAEVEANAKAMERPLENKAAAAPAEKKSR